MATTTTLTTTEEKPKVARKKKDYKSVPRGRIYVTASYNNTIMTAADDKGNALVWSSAGKVGFKGPKKATPFAATTLAKDLFEKLQPYGLKEAEVFITGIGPGREAAVRGLHAAGITILSIKDATPVPHNGCRLAGRRRV